MDEKQMENKEAIDDTLNTEEENNDVIEDRDQQSNNEDTSLLEKQCNEYRELAQRVQADFENYKRRNANLRQESIEKGVISVIDAMLPVVDNFERAIEMIDESNEKNAIVEGVINLHKQMIEVLSSFGLEEIPSDGEEFDPNYHEAVMSEEASSPEHEGKVTLTMRKGYCMKDKVVRYAMVKVAK